MARNWQRQRARDRGAVGRTDAIDAARFADEIEGRNQDRPKAELRAEAEALTAGVPVTVLPTVRKLHCRVCGHQGKAQHPPGRIPRFRCRKCGSMM